jgi:hypothetical protein
MLRISGDKVRPADRPQVPVTPRSCASPARGCAVGHQLGRPPTPAAEGPGGACGSSRKCHRAVAARGGLRSARRDRPRADLTVPRVRLGGRVVVCIRIAAGQYPGDDPSAKLRRSLPRREISPARRLPAPERLQLRDRHRPPEAVAMARDPRLHRPYRGQTAQRRELARARRVLRNAHRNPTWTPIPGRRSGTRSRLARRSDRPS